jgi:hypothetical protein
MSFDCMAQPIFAKRNIGGVEGPHVRLEFPRAQKGILKTLLTTAMIETVVVENS